jgi:hypothetical protein
MFLTGQAIIPLCSTAASHLPSGKLGRIATEHRLIWYISGSKAARDVPFGEIPERRASAQAVTAEPP